MGYTTFLDGHFDFSRPLTEAEVDAINTLSDAQHDPARFPSYYCQWRVEPPSYYCQWRVEPSPVLEGGEFADRPRLVWDGGEKFYSYMPWLRYLIENFFKPWGVELYGTVSWEGEDGNDDLGKIVADGYKVHAYRGGREY